MTGKKRATTKSAAAVSSAEQATANKTPKADKSAEENANKLRF